MATGSYPCVFDVTKKPKQSIIENCALPLGVVFFHYFPVDHPPLIYYFAGIRYFLLIVQPSPYFLMSGLLSIYCFGSMAFGGGWAVMEQKTGLRSHVEDLTTIFPEFTVWLKVARCWNPSLVQREKVCSLFAFNVNPVALLRVRLYSYCHLKSIGDSCFDSW